MRRDIIYGALEAGGTKMVCAFGLGDGTILDQITIQTKTPQETIPEILNYFVKSDFKAEAIGIGSFGPIDVSRTSKSFGHILDTPKLSWRGYDLFSQFRKALHIPIAIDTDVNAACLGEVTYGAAKGLTNVLYLTVGTGVGAGIISGGNMVHGMLHPEAGHMLIKHHPDDHYEGRCPYHKDCLEGLASGPAIEERWLGEAGYRGAAALAMHEEVWELESYYLAQAMVNYILTLSPQRIILGGGIMEQKQLFALIRKKTVRMLGDYLKTPQLEDINTYIVPASLDGKQGIMGCLRLAMTAESL